MPYDDVDALERAFNSNEDDARALVRGLDERRGTARAQAGTWSVSECLDHLAISSRVYLSAMNPAAERARSKGRRRRGPAVPGVVGGWFVRSLEPPVRTGFRMRAPRKIQPRDAPPLGLAVEQFVASQGDVVAFLRTYAAIDLAGVLFPNPFIPGVRFSLATGLHVLLAHQRRLLWQAWRIRRAMEETIGLPQS
jgi:hypothetical protein